MCEGSPQFTWELSAKMPLICPIYESEGGDEEDM